MVSRPRARSARPASDTAAARSVALTRSSVAAEARPLRSNRAACDEARQRLPLSLASPFERLLLSTAEERALRGSEPMSGVEQQVDLLASLAGELVDGPHRERRLPSASFTCCASARRPSFLSTPANRVRSAHELGQLDAVEAIQLVFELDRHIASFPDAPPRRSDRMRLMTIPGNPNGATP